MKKSFTKRLISLFAAVMMITAAVSIQALAADTVISDYWKVTNTTAANAVFTTNAQSYEGEKSLHIVRSSGDSDVMVLSPTWTGSQGPIFEMPQYGIIQNFLSFYAKGTLPDASALGFYSYAGNGVIFAYDNDGSLNVTVGEPDANGWKRVSVSTTYTNTTTRKAGYLNHVMFRIFGDCDFYMDSIEYHVAMYKNTQTGWSYVKDQAFFTNQDPGFEAGAITEYDWGAYPYNDASEFDAASTRTSLVISDGGWNTSGSTDNNYVAFTNKYAHTGNNSAHIVFTDSESSGNTLKLTPYWASTSENSIIGSDFTYADNGDVKIDTEVSFYAKGHLPEAGSFRISTGNGKMKITVDASTWVKGMPDGNGWYLVTASGTTGRKYDRSLYGYLDGHQNSTGFYVTGPCNFYMDDVTILTKTYTGGTNLRLTLDPMTGDRGFESTSGTMGASCGETTEIRALVYNYTDSVVQLSWSNPNNDNITAFKVLNGSGTDVTGGAAFDLNPMAINKFDITGLESGKKYVYTVVMTAGGEDYSKSITVVPFIGEAASLRYSAGEKRYPLWNGQWSPYYSHSYGTTGYLTNTNFYVDFDEKHSGNSSLKYMSNSDTSNNRFVAVTHQMSDLDTESTYTLSFWAKAEDSKATVTAAFTGTNAIVYSPSVSLAQSGYYLSTDWTHYTLTLPAPATSSTPFFFWIRGMADAVYIDDMQLVKTGDDTNLIQNGGFEYEVSDVEFDYATGTVSWNMPAGLECDSVIVSKLLGDGTYGAIANVNPEFGGNSYIDSTAKADSVYFVKTYSSYFGFTSYGTASSQTAVSDPEFSVVTFDDAPFSSLGENATVQYSNLSDGDLVSGYYMASYAVRNISGASPVNTTFFLALYKNSKLNKVVRVETSVAQNGVYGDATVIKGVIGIDAEEYDSEANYELKSFLWDSGFKPVGEAYSITN